jgi:hypothetical protein
MNLESLVIDSQNNIEPRQGVDSIAGNFSEILLMEVDSYKLVGGGSSIVLLG